MLRPGYRNIGQRKQASEKEGDHYRGQKERGWTLKNFWTFIFPESNRKIKSHLDKWWEEPTVKNGELDRHKTGICTFRWQKYTCNNGDWGAFSISILDTSKDIGREASN